MKVGVFHPGTQHSWQTSLALQDLDRLAFFATSIFYQPDRFPYNLEKVLPGALARRLHGEFLRFSHPRLDPSLIRTTGVAEWLERISARAGMPALAKWIDRRGNESFSRSLSKTINSADPFALWGFSGSARVAFEVARERERACVLDRTIGDFRVYNALMAQLQDEYAPWFLPTEKAVSAETLDNEQREYELADVIVAGSEFAAGTVRDMSNPAVAAKVEVLPYCYDEGLFGAQPAPVPLAAGAPVRFLFVGQINPRKGIHHLLEAFSRISPSAASLTLVGNLAIPPETFARYADRVTFLPTVARSYIPQIMREHHVLVFPSYFEGSALSLLEALASGLAIIQTPSSGNDVTEAANYSFANYRGRIGDLLGRMFGEN